MRWKALFFNKDNQKQESPSNNYGFKSMQGPPSRKGLSAFENDL